MTNSPIEDRPFFLSTLTAGSGERRLAAALRSTVTRVTDLVARYGGEEFAVLLPQTDAEGAGKLAERIRSAVAELAIPNPASASGHVTVSIGVADFCPSWTGAPSEPPSPEQLNGQVLVEKADGLLYTAKSAGRNRVAV